MTSVISQVQEELVEFRFDNPTEVAAYAVTFFFVVLKVLGYFPWSWWWVFSPTLAFFGMLILALAWLGFQVHREEMEDEDD